MSQEERPYSAYQLIGGDEPLRELVDRFYDYMDSLPETAGIRAMHPKDLRSAREKLFMFFSGWMGGPDRYIAAFGHPRLRARHLPFPIGRDERDQWMLCMEKALEDMPNLDAAFKSQLLSSLHHTATFMINQEPNQ